MKVKALFNTIGGAIKKHLPSILTGAAIATGTGAVIVTVPATVKAVRAVDNAKAEADRDLTKGEVIKVVWKFYIPTAALGASAIACAVLSNVESSKRITALAAAYAMSEEKLEGVRKKLLDKIGEEKTSDVLAEATQEIADEKTDGKIEEAPIPASTLLDKEDIPENYPVVKPLWYDSHSGRYFRASQADVDNAMAAINKLIAGYDEATLNDLYFELGLKDTTDGGMFGWQGGHELLKAVKPDEYITHPSTGEHAKVLTYNCKYLF